MAMLAGGGVKAQGTVEIIFKAVGIAPLTAKVNKAFRNMSGRASYYAGMIQSRMGYAFLGASAAIVGFMGVAIKKFAEFDQAMKNTASVTNVTAGEIRNLSEYAQELGMMGTASAKEVADAMYFLGSAGYEYGEILKAVQPIMKLAVATQSDMANTARITMQALKAFGKEADSTDKFVRVFAAGISSSQLRIEWLGNSLKHLGPVAHEVSMSIEETTAALAMLHDIGIQSGMAGRHLRRMIQGTIKDTDQATKVLSRYGLELSDISIKMHGFGNVIKLLHEKNVDLAEVFKLFGLRASASAAGLMRMSKTWDEYLQNVKDITKLQKMYDTQMSGMIAQFKRLSNTVSVFMAKFSESYAPIIRALTNLFTGLFNKLTEIPKWQQQMLAWVAVITAVGLAFLGINMIISGMLTQGMMTFTFLSNVIGTTFVSALKSAGKAMMFLYRTMVINFLNLFTRATHKVGQFGIAVMTLKHHTKGQWLANFATKIGRVGLRALTLSITLALIAIIVLAAIATWKNYEESIKKWAKESSKAIKVFKTDLQNLIRDTKDIPGKIEKFIKESSLPGWFKSYVNWLKETNKEYDKILKLGLKAKGLGISEKQIAINKAITKAAVEDVKNQFKDASKTVGKTIESILNVLGEKLPGILAKIQAGMKGLFPTWEDEDDKDGPFKKLNMFGEKFENFTENLETKWTDTIFELVKGTKTWLDVWNDVLDNALHTFIHGFVQQMLKAWGGMVAQMVFGVGDVQGGAGKGIWDAIVAIGKTILGIKAAPTGFPTTQISEAFPIPLVKYAKGTNYVPRDMVAQLHQGEAVIPASQNRGQELTIINIIDPSFVPAGLARDPSIVLNIINDDVMMAGSTRRTMRRYLS